jgi:hypothetical protein
MNYKINNFKSENNLNYYKNLNFDTLELVKSLTVEQSANLTYFYNHSTEHEYYKYSWNFTFLDFKKIIRIKFSVKLRVKFKILLDNFLNINLISKEKTLLFCKNSLIYKKKYLNKWGRFKYLNYTNKITSLCYFYLYKFFFTMNSYAIFKKNKSIDKKLKNLSMIFYFYNLNEDFFFLPTIEIIAKELLVFKYKIKKKPIWLFRSIPKNKIFKKILSIKSLNRSLVSNLKNFNFEKLIFLNSSYKFDFEITKTDVLFLLIKVLKNFSSNSLIKDYLFIFYFQYFNFQHFDFFFLIFFFNLFFDIFKEKIIFEKNQFFLNFDFKLNLEKNWFEYKSKEWFTKSYLSWTNFKKKPFSSFLGLNNIISESIYSTKYNFSNYLIFKTFENFKTPIILLKNNFYPNKIFLKKNFIWIKNWNFFSLKITITKAIETIFSKTSHLLDKSLKLLYYNNLLRFFPKLYHINKLKFSLSLPINFSLLFNWYIYLDVKSKLFNNFFFYTYSSFNLDFFFYKIYTILYDKYLGLSTLLSNFETYFFWKKLIFQTTAKELILYDVSFKLLASTLFNLTPKLKTKLSKKLKKKLWFTSSVFGEELEHLTFESNYSDLERVRELIRSKELADLWLNKLTNYLMKMRQQKIEVGNIQYGPDFTQQHEFALTLKWGLELEILKYTRFIIMWRFFGWNNFIVKNNFIRKKINFLYNLTKSKNFNNDFNSTLNIKPKTSELLSLKNVYEITRLQLATAITTYKNIYKLKTIQLDYFHTHFPFNSETTTRDFYKFIFSVFERYFLFDSYKKYYLKTKIKKKIRFSKMIYKKVFNRFILSIRFHRNLIFLKDSFNYYFFWLFRSLKKKISKKIKSNYFYTVVHTLVYRFSKSFLIPSQKTMIDYKILNLEIQNLNLTFSNKSKLIFNFKTVDFLKLELLNYNSIFKILKIEFFIKKQVFFNKNVFSYEQTHNQLVCFDNLQNFFQNFLTEFFYEIFNNFFLEKKNFIKFNCKNKFKNPNMYSSIISTSTSTSFFFLLESKIIKHSKKLNNLFIWGFLIEFTLFLKNKRTFKKLSLALDKFIFNSENKFLNSINFYDNNCKNYFFLFYIYSLLNNDILKWKFLTSTLNSFIFRFLSFLKEDNSNFLLKKLHFETFWFRNFTKQLELLFVDFLFEFCNISINRKFSFDKKINN